MAPKTAAELALAKKYELLRQKKAAAQNQQQQQHQKATERGISLQKSTQAPKEGISRAGPATTPQKSKHTPIPFPKPSEQAPSKPLTAHEKALQALKAARGGGASRAGIGKLPQKRAPLSAPARPPAVLQNPQTSSAPANASAASDRSAARPRQEGGRSSALQHDSHPKRFEGRGAAGNADGVQHKRQKVDVPAEPSGGAEDQEATVFVGDLPPGCGHFELQELFSQLANVVNIKHLEHKSIAFVTVESDAEVGHIIDVADTSGLHIHGAMIRVARAHQPSDGQRGGHMPAELPGAEPLKVQEARLAARALAEQVDISAPELRPPPERGLVCYNDL
ncbi:hypothetical protein CVIRNUC_003170 [Coccomyxa viridis]|uniref:RRM domain-containing protein n=1 Tax=Coccomyxa viridis TaxID=1274662 RepID=A0AAV1I0I6_9CHLO|nr:hypothetical protein CVIRNUC_003170 [Coccomyxa viridis]